MAERGWVDADELELLTGERPPRPSAAGSSPRRAGRDAGRLADLVGAAGPLDEVAALDERQRAVLGGMEGVDVRTSARRHAAGDALADHPALAALAAGGLAPDAPAGIDRASLRELERRGLVVERDGCGCHADRDHGRRRPGGAPARREPGGFTVSRFRDAAGITRRHAMPLLGELDARRITRRGDVRIAGPRLPSLPG